MNITTFFALSIVCVVAGVGCGGDDGARHDDTSSDGGDSATRDADTSCPSDAPTEGSACAASQSCRYPPTGGCTTPVMAFCLDSKWRTTCTALPPTADANVGTRDFVTSTWAS